jgi:hypothetical protein
MDQSSDTKEPGLLGAAVLAVPLLLAAAIQILPQVDGIWLKMGVAAAVLAIGAVLFVYIVRGARRALIREASDERVLGYKDDRDTGILRKGTIENVSLRATTIHRLVDSLTHAIPPNARKAALYNCGHEIGRSWVADFLKELPRLHIGRHDFPRQLLKWCEYDATAGMGRLTIAVDPQSGDGLAMLSNSFLSRSKAQFPLNWWFAGYLAGSLCQLLPHRVTVELLSPTNATVNTVYFRVFREGSVGGSPPTQLKVRDPRSVARLPVLWKRLRTPLAEEDASPAEVHQGGGL